MVIGKFIEKPYIYEPKKTRMETHFEKIKNYLVELGLNITIENTEEEVFVVNDNKAGLQNLVIGCADPIVIIEQFLFELDATNIDTLKFLLEKNRTIIHGAFVLDETGAKVIFRDTLQLENLDLNEIEGSINSLSLLLSEYANELIAFSKK